MYRKEKCFMEILEFQHRLVEKNIKLMCFCKIKLLHLEYKNKFKAALLSRAQPVLIQITQMLSVYILVRDKFVVKAAGNKSTA